MTQPIPWNQTRHVNIVWLDYATGAGVSHDGSPIAPRRRDNRRKTASLTDLLDTGQAYQANRIVLTGAPTAAQASKAKIHWLLSPTHGWRTHAKGHWLDKYPTGRFELDVEQPDKSPIEIRLAREWFNDGLSPDQARSAWQTTGHLLDRATQSKGVLLASPARTATNLWAAILPNSLAPQPIDPDIAALLHRTSGQHRIEHLAATSCDCGDCSPTITNKEIPAIHEVDGRFMFAALCKELGAGQVTQITADQTAHLMVDKPYEAYKARCTVKVPAEWAHVGIIGQQLDDGVSWHFPRRPGATFEAWADSREILVAKKFGWDITPHEGIHFGPKGRWLDTWSDQLCRARNAADYAHPDEAVTTAARHALRNILIRGIGAFATRSKDRTVIVKDPRRLPENLAEAPQQLGDSWIGRVKGTTNTASPLYRPELAAQVWARSRAAILHSKYSDGEAGLLHMPADTICGVYGDAIHTTAIPSWARSVDDGGLDDGKPGRLRVKGGVAGPFPTPATTSKRYKLLGKKG